MSTHGISTTPVEAQAVLACADSADAALVPAVAPDTATLQTAGNCAAGTASDLEILSESAACKSPAASKDATDHIPQEEHAAGAGVSAGAMALRGAVDTPKLWGGKPSNIPSADAETMVAAAAAPVALPKPLNAFAGARKSAALTALAAEDQHAAAAAAAAAASRHGSSSSSSRGSTADTAATAAAAAAAAAATSVATKGSELLRARVFLCKEGKEVERHKWNLLGDLAAARAAKAKLSKKLQALKALPGALETLKASIGQRLQALELPALLTAFGEDVACPFVFPQLHQFPGTWPPVLTDTVYKQTVDFVAGLKASRCSTVGAPSNKARGQGSLRDALQVAIGLHPDVLYLIAHTAPGQILGSSCYC
ncbi:dynein assembly factor 3, axonemal homolog [Cyclospora cayetanensis]|uniref:Dynein assembly factor 3, axonemal homolog n=1 Tax=Cyclospora cayetanensis TaxID=88456 RepID=A0A6P6RRL1_9EIME|nr:dynein assembly factor 3, axonemal homolog [Cyclospora cayetanensis]